MDFPFFQNPWDASSYPRYGRSFRGIPVQVMPEPSPSHSLKSKTVSIPVRFVGSERGRSESAIKIQKVFRGFLVRKNVKKILEIREQVNEMERSVSKTETVDLIRNDSKERLKVNEILMSLLFKLDTVKGVDSCVRDLRKSVIKRAIALQEMVDAITNSDEQSVNSSSAEVVGQGQDMIDSSDDCNQTLESENLEETTSNAECMPNSNEQEGTEDVTDEGNEKEARETSRNESQTDQENAVEEEEADKEKEGTGMNPIPISKEEGGRKKMVERLMEDNEKMMRLMEALTERNEMQSRMLRALGQRVELLEKAFLCDKVRRKKRRSDDRSQCGGRR